ncbi:uncharacterized protein LOC135466505 isoform X2 [Liolophura sinensis]|uniref:uncharacterized protein LOC135466505 isoform X2 n=1 Tax=Liolophura sinensis TaxID=3198878 RepID=UPI0031591907
METVNMENTFTPLRPKRTSPCFDYSEGDVAVGGCKTPGEGKGTGGWSLTMDNGPDSPTTAKRRRMELWGFCTPSTVSSCSGSPSRGTTPDTTLDDSMLSTPSESPAGTLTREDRRDFKKRYKKDELWPAIESNYQYLMDDEIIETCKSTESDLSWDEDDVTVNTKVSFTEFMQQFKELTDWLSQIHLVSQRKATSRSEKYLNQAYHEELLQSSPRRKLFNDYAKQLLKRYPSLKEEINQRIQHLNGHWQTLQKVVLPQNGFQDAKTMLSDLELDLHCIRSWLTGVEGKLLPLSIRSNWTVIDIEAKLKEHLVLQREIESQSKVISAVLKLSERLQSDDHVELDGELRSLRERHQRTAVKLERRWHNVWLSSLEWQCRLEEALAQIKEFGKKPLHNSDPSLWLNFENSTSFTEGFSSGDEVELPKNDEDERVTGESDPSDTCVGVCESSDEPNSSDVIPFYDEEYEKICDVEQPTDEDREVQLLSEEMHERNHSSKLTALNKSDANLIEFKSEMMDILDERCSTHFINKPKKRKSESRDIGYSSEGYSNDEQLDPYDLRKICWQRAPSWNGLELHGKQVVGDHKPGELVSMDTVVIRRRPASLPLDSSLHALTSDLSSANKESPWRHSITSAYDTSSNCGSDPEALIISEDVVTSDAKSSNCEAILNSPTADYYKMITVDTDFSTDRNDTDEQLSSTDHGNSPKQHPENPSTVVKIPEAVLTDSAYQEYSSLNNFINNTYLGSISEIVQSSNSVHPGRGQKVSSEYGAEDVEAGMVVSGFVPDTETPTCHFIQEDHPGENEFLGLGVSDWKTGSHGRARKPWSTTKLNVGAANSVPDTDTSSPRSGTDSLVESSCEASGEETSDDEDSDEFSTASDDDHRCSSAFASFGTLVGSDRNLTDRPDPISYSANHSGIPRSASAYSNYDKMSSRTRVKSRRSRRERPWSIVALSDLKKQMNSQEKPMFKSESAIDSMSTQHSEIYTSTPKANQSESSSPDQISKPFATFPRDKSRLHRPRYMRRTKSMEDPENKAKCSGSMSKRKLSYEKSANPESIDSDMSISDQCQISILISSPEMNRSYASEDLVSSMSLIRDLEHTMIYSTTSSGSDTDLAYVTPKQSMSESGSESDEQVNSTGSFSETAWDNYQDPLYPTASEAPTEEPLHWEPQDELEFEEEEFRMEDGIKLSAEVIAERSDKLRSKERKSSAYLQEEDSDSDLEDLHHVIQQSVEQLHVTDSSLKKRRSDPMGTGISLDPSKYAEHVLTCETNLKCLEEVLDLPLFLVTRPIRLKC